MKLDYGEEDKEIRLSGYDEFVFQDRDAGEVRQDPHPTMELAFNFNEEDAGSPLTQVLTPQCTVTLTLMSVQVMVANQTLEAKLRKRPTRRR